MQRTDITISWRLYCWLLVGCVALLAGCSQEPDDAQDATPQMIEQPLYVEESPIIVASPAEAPLDPGGTIRPDPPVAEPVISARPPFDRFDRYKVELGVDKELRYPGPAGELRVWIGHEALAAHFASRMATDQTFLPALGEWAVIEPFAPAFDISPARSACIKIDPTGSEVPFALAPKSTGQFNVGANVYLYNSDNCAGAGIPKAASTLVVTVAVDKEEVLLDHLKDVWTVFWDNLLIFLGALFALVFGWLVARIKRRTGGS